MTQLEALDERQLREALDQVEDKTPAMRLIAGIAAKNGITQSELADWFDVERKTIYNWLSRLDTEDLVGSVTDERRSGRRRKLSEKQLSRFRNTLHTSPNAVGFDASAWTPRLVRRFLLEEFGVEYSIPSCRRLMREAGLRYERGTVGTSETGPEEAPDVEDSFGTRSGIWTPK